MNEDFVTYELAVKLKEKGFDEPFYFYYRTDDKLIHHAMVTKPLVYCDKIDDEVVCAPTISQVLKWLREEKKLHIEVMFIRPLHNRVKYYITDTDGSRGDFMDVSDEHYETWEQATLAGIEYVLDNLI